MSARLTLICHAATEATRLGRFPADEDLDPEAAAALGKAPPLPAGLWLAAPERRAQRTAALSARRPVETEVALRDWDLGLWRGRLLAEVAGTDAAGLARWRSDPSTAPHGGESLDALIARVSAFLALRAARGGRVAAVAHPAVVRAAIVAALAADAPTFWRVEAAPLVRVRLSHDGRRWVLQGLVPPGG